MISIVVPVYNKEKTIQRTLESIITQDFEDYELIIVDDGSTDHSVDIISSNHTDKIKIYSKDNGGVSSARNFGVQKARGEWIVFMDADDWFEPDALNHFYSLTVQENLCDFFCCNYYIKNSVSKYLYSNKYVAGYVKNNFFAWCSGLCMPRAGAALYRREVLLRNPFDDRLKRYEDAESIFSLMRNLKIYRSPVPVMTYNCTSNDASLPRKDISEDYIGHLDLKGKRYWEQYALYQLYKQGLELYPNDMNRIYNKRDFDKVKFKIAPIIIGQLKRFHII